MRKIIPLIVLLLLSAFFTKAQNVSQAENNLALQLVGAQDGIISSELLSTSKVFYTYEDAATGIRYVSLQQTYKGIPVYNQILALSFRNGKLASNFGALDPNIEKAINVPSGIPSITAESAVQSALSDRGFRASQMAIAITRKDEGKFVEFGNMGISRENITAQLTWVPDELTKQYYLAWQVYIIPKTTSDYWMVRVNAVDNSILGVDNYTDYDNWGDPFENPSIRYPGFDYGTLSKSEPATKSPFDFKKVDDPNLVTTASYRVVPLPAESPLHPGGAPALRTDPWANAGVVANAVTLRWHTGAAATDYDYTRSNNVWAYHDRNNNNSGDPARSATSTTAFPNLTFDFVPDFTMEPVVTSPPNQQFNITNLFYWNNIAHDILYAYGFTEAGKNFQDDNLGRGGAGNDHVNAEAQDGSGSNNANFSTPADGGSGRMQMYLWTAPTPDRDGDVDNGIILHELGHGVSNRSNQGGTGCLGNQEQGGEGWSDYIGLMLTQNWATATLNSGFNSPRGIGTYALNQPNNGPGIRPQRYCTDFAVNNATYATLPGQAIPHGVGWVWCSALWEMTWEIINDPSSTGIDPNIYNFAGTGGNIVAMRLMMEGLRTQPCQPGFITARDAILAADLTLYGGAHTCAIWRAFARRGMGFGAAQGSSNSINDQTVSFAMPPTCVVAGPTVTINQAAAQVDPTSTSPINFTVVFSEVVTGFATGDVSLGGTAGATTGTVTGSGTTYNVAVSGMTNTGTVIATIAAGVAVNGANEPNNPSTSTDNTVTYITTPPGACTSFVGSVGPANTPVGLRAFRDGALSTCAAPGTCTASTLSGAFHYRQHTWTNPVNAVQCVTVSYSNPTTNFSFVTAHNGSVVLTNFCTNWLGDPGSSAPAGGTPIVWSFNVPALATVVFHVGNVTAGQTADYILDISAPICAPAAPGVTINQAAAQPDPTSTSPINYTVVFDQAVTGFATGDVVLSGTANASTAIVTGSGTTYNVAVSGMASSGTVIATVPAGVAINGAGDPNTASTSTDNTVTYNLPLVACTTFVGQVTAADAPIGFRSFRDGVASTCAAPGTCGAPLAGTFQHRIHTWTNPVNAVQCVTVTFTNTNPPNQSFVTAYDGPVNLTNLCANYLGDPGASPTTATSIVWSFNAPANATINFLVTNITGGQTAGYSLEISAPNCVPICAVTVDPVPNSTVCAGATHPAVVFTSTPPGATFSWTNNNTAIGLGASGNGNLPAFTATNPGVTPLVGTITVTPISNIVTSGSATFNHTGAMQTWTVPAGVTSVNITTLGAQGGTGADGVSNGTPIAGGVGGRGSRATGTLAVTPGQVLNIFVGGAGGTPTSGFNGGGTGGNANSGGGGGASDVRVGGTAPADRIIVAGGGGGGGRGGCEGSSGPAGVGGTGGSGDGNGQNGADSPTSGGVAGGGFGGVGPASGAAGIGCGGFLGAPGFAGAGEMGGNGGAGQSCCCFSFSSIPGGGGGGGGFLGGGGGGGGSAGTTGCSGNDKGAGGGGAGGSSYTGGVTSGVITPDIQSGDGQVLIDWNIVTVCNGPTRSFTITVNPTPVVNPIPNQVLCQNQTTAPVNFTGSPAGVVYQWTNNNTLIGLAASGTGNIPAFVALNPTNVQQVATITVTPVTGLSTPVTTTFNFTGAVQTFTVPAGITSLNLKSWGAQGNSNAGGILGGRGGYAEGNLAVTPGQVLNIFVGGGAATSVNGGFNGGGAAGSNPGCAQALGGGGGGASDIRIAPYALANRVLVGAGGGGAGGNRTAGCGRGAGGGGGGGLWGGGGGAGWPGVPPGGPVPTGGTQSAGGAGGVTTFTPGPTNGLPGVLAVGGAGGNEVGSAQGTPTGPAEPGAVGGGLIGASGNYNPANNWNGQSGAGGSSYIGGVTSGTTTPGLRVGAGQVQITYTPPSATTCFGTSRSFTITVNPNANLIIIADPGTTICEGDPTLLTVYDAGAASAPGVLYNQTAAQVNGSPSQVFEPANAAFTSQAADDFLVPAGNNWNITQITANGIGAGSPTSVNVFFYANTAGNLPGAAIASFNNVASFVRTGGNYTVTLPSTVTLGGGRYWMSFQVNMSFAAGGQWFWGNFGGANIGNEYAWQNPGGGFATPCNSWGYGGTGCNVGGGAANRNNIFSLVGTSVGLGPQSTGTFLWSPAAGLSSTTSNPVAASPMNTTTYTVTRTTVPGGCVASAQITITVNKRPVVTTQPAATVRCVGNTATFTAGGTGTGLTYQWQESLAGCAGPWVNLANGGAYSGVNTATLTVAPVTLAMNGRGYRLVLGGTCSPWTPPTNISNCAILTVNPNPVITVTPTVTCGSATGICNPITASGNANTYTWSPVTNLFLDCNGTIPYTAGTNAATVYARPTALTVYTVTGTFTATGCFSTATVVVNYTPPAPTVTPNPVSMCLGDPAVLLRSSSSTPGNGVFNSGPLALAIPDGPTTWPQTSFPGVVTPNLAVSGIPANATITGMSVRLNLPHTYIADMVIVLKAPNGNVFNLAANVNRTGGPGANFTNTVISSASSTPLSAGLPPYTGTFAPDAVGATYIVNGPGGGNTFPGGPTTPAGYIPTVTNFSGLYSVPNGNWTLGMYDWGFGDLGTLTNWELRIDYIIGVPSTPAVWSPAGGLFSNAAATVPYVAGTPVDSVWARPTPSGVYPYQVTVQSLPVQSVFTNPANIVINAAGTGTPYPANLVVSGLPTSGVSVDSVRLTGISHTWGNDIDILLQSPSGQNVILMSDIGGTVAVPNATYTFRDGAPALNAGAANPTGTYRPTNNDTNTDNWPAPGPGAFVQATPTLALFGNTANVNGTWRLLVFDDVGGDAGNISGGFTIWFNAAIPACTSPARTVVVTVNDPTTVTTQPVNQTICTDKVATFSVVAGGTGPFTYQWQVSTNGGNPPWTNIANGGVYSGATTSTLTITAPPVSMNGYFYRVIITGAAPCAAATSNVARLTVNPLPVVVISANPTSLMPGMTTTLTSTVSPNAAQTYTWLRNGVAVGGNTATHTVDIDGLGNYQLRVTDVNGCTNLSNIITIKDSASAKCFIYPNPTSGMFQVRYYSVANNVLPRTLTVYDSKGDRVFSKMYTIGRPYDRMDVDMRAYGKGLYWVEIGDLNGNRITMCRVVIQ